MKQGQSWKTVLAVGGAFIAGAALAASAATRAALTFSEKAQILNRGTVLYLDFFRTILEYETCDDLTIRINTWVDRYGEAFSKVTREIIAEIRHVGDERLAELAKTYHDAVALPNLVLDRCRPNAEVIAAFDRFYALTPGIGT